MVLVFLVTLLVSCCFSTTAFVRNSAPDAIVEYEDPAYENVENFLSENEKSDNSQVNKRAMMRFGKRAMMRFGKRAMMRFG
ncbi:unnamed protein product [Caenorhabditis angaria]|uniref:Uncharacterized protein n=1 Tax=Caenorhabditis angaria TaxID=860376 RepID=A0A9P1N7I6_9PELO|nr:unnamed protein product [Caenorhabditis angaria]